MPITDIALACAIDNSTPYITYHGNLMLVVQSAQHAKENVNSFTSVEHFIELFISHESIHVVIRSLEDGETSDSLDDIEVIVERNGRRFQVTVNNVLFASDNSGIVLP